MTSDQYKRFGRGKRIIPTNVEAKSQVKSEVSSYTPFESSAVTIQPKPSDYKQPIINYGDKAILTTNYVRLNFQERKIWMYHVAFTPDVDSTAKRHRVLISNKNYFPEIIVFDGNILYTQEPLEKSALCFECPLSSTGSSLVQCNISFTKEILLSESTSLLNIIFRKILRLINLKLVGRNYFDVDLSIPMEKYKIHIWPGFTTSIKRYDGGVFLCVDVAHRMLRMETVYSLMRFLYSDANNNSKGSDNFQEKCLKAIVGKTVITRYNNKTYRIDDIEWIKNPSDSFKLSDGQSMTYIDYYKDVYEKDIIDVRQPLLVHRPKDRSIQPSKREYSSFRQINNTEDKNEHLIYLIPEFCYLTGLDEAIRSDFSAMREISNYIHAGPNERFISLQRFLQRLSSSKEAQLELNKWGIDIGYNFEKVEGREMPNEKLVVHGGQYQFEVNPATGWISKLSKAKLFSCATLDQWICIHTTRDKQTTVKFVNSLITNGNQMGMNISIPIFKEIPNDRIENYINNIKSVVSQGNMKLIMTIFPSQREDRYAAVKRLCYCDLSIPSQVIQTKTISNLKKLNSVSQRVAMQLNCKLGGSLWSVKIPCRNYMVVGIDVNHSNIGVGRKSVVGFVSSVNDSLTKWHSTVNFQNQGTDLVDSLTICLLKAIQKYQEYNNNSVPSRIIVFRDGVSDGMYDALNRIEILPFLKVLEENYPQPVPHLSFIIIKKRIKTRILCSDPLNDQLNNPKPGTIIDHTITTNSHVYPSFFLISQHFSQGTILPSCFVVLFNNSTLTVENLQLLSYKATYLYYNWPGTVKVPAPCQYAHKLAFLTAQSLVKEASPGLRDTLYYL